MQIDYSVLLPSVATTITAVLAIGAVLVVLYLTQRAALTILALIRGTSVDHLRAISRQYKQDQLYQTRFKREQKNR